MYRAVDLTDAGLERLPALGRLQSLTIVDGDQLTDRGLESLGRLTSLVELRLDVSRRMTPRLLQLASLTNLRHLELAHCGQAENLRRIAARRRHDRATRPRRAQLPHCDHAAGAAAERSPQTSRPASNHRCARRTRWRCRERKITWRASCRRRGPHHFRPNCARRSDRRCPP